MENLAMDVAELHAQLFRFREEVFNTTSIRREETATKEEAIKVCRTLNRTLRKQFRF